MRELRRSLHRHWFRSRSCRYLGRLDRRWSRLGSRGRGNLGLGEGVQRALANHYSAADAGQTVSQRLRYLQHPQIAAEGAGPRGDRIGSQPEQVDQHAVVSPPPAGGASPGSWP